MACDDGVLRLFGPDGASAGVHYRRSFGHVEGRVLSVAWHPSGRTLVSGHSDGCIRAWDAASTREIYRITACASLLPPLFPVSTGMPRAPVLTASHILLYKTCSLAQCWAKISHLISLVNSQTSHRLIVRSGGRNGSHSVTNS